MILTLEKLEREYAVSKEDRNVALKLFEAYRRLNLRNETKYMDLRANLGTDYELRDLPLPTLDQRKAFAERLANEHSWYKSLDKPTNFYLYLNPTIMMAWGANRRPQLLEDKLWDQDLIHLRAPTKTVDYRQTYGYLDYEFLLAEKPSISTRAISGRKLLLSDRHYEVVTLSADMYSATFRTGPYDKLSHFNLERAKKYNVKNHDYLHKNYPESYQRQCIELETILIGLNRLVEKIRRL